MRTLLKSSSAMTPSPRSHASNVVEGVRQCATRVDRGRPRWTREFECYLNLLMLGFWYSTVPHVRTLKKVMDSVRMPSTVDGVWTHANACEGVSENAALILDCWPLHTAERFGAIYRIVSYHDMLCSIVSYLSFFPHDHIVPSLIACCVVVSGSMAESGVDLTFDDHTYGNTGMNSDVAPSSMMAHLQPSLANSR